ncbi:MAG: polysaccharide deacetylase family protein, partial [Clostridium sp.]
MHSVETAEKVVAITINVGFGKQYTKEILEVLEDEGVKVSFFVMGSWIDRYKEDLLMIHKSDHEIGNNSSTYPHLTKLKREQIIGEVNECSEKIKEISMDEARIFRPPYGDYNDISQKAINDIGYYPIIWDVDSQDNSEKLSEEISDTILKQVSNGSIILFHNNSEKTKDALKDSIRQ